MITNLNAFTISLYGAVENERADHRGLPSGGGYITSAFQVAAIPDHYHVSSAPVWFDYSDGMAVLQVLSGQNSEETVSFYLDKPVRLNPGVPHRIVPFEGRCTVMRVSDATAQWRSIPAPETADAVAIEPSYYVHRICTFFYQEKPKGFYFRGERHQAFEVFYVDRGRLHNVIAGQDHVMDAHQLAVLLPNQWHMQFAEPETPVSLLTISFEMDCPFSDRLGNRVFTANDAMLSLLRNMMRDFENRPPFFGDSMLCYLKLLLSELLLSLSDAPAPRLASNISRSNEQRIVDAALQRISARGQEKLTVSSLAKSCNVSSAYLTQLFQKLLHESPGEYLCRSRLEEGRELLKCGQRNVTEIAEAMGFSSVQAFSKQFRHRFGMSPTAYAKAVKQ